LDVVERKLESTEEMVRDQELSRLNEISKQKLILMTQIIQDAFKETSIQGKLIVTVSHWFQSFTILA
jgi:hypothetical protein